MSAGDYAGLIDRRFPNPAIVDTVRRVAFGGSPRHTGFVLPVLRGAHVRRGREDWSAIEPDDPVWDRLQTAARSAHDRPLAWLERSRLYGGLIGAPRFAAACERWLSLIWPRGSLAALRTYAGGRPYNMR